MLANRKRWYHSFLAAHMDIATHCTVTHFMRECSASWIECMRHRIVQKITDLWCVDVGKPKKMVSLIPCGSHGYSRPLHCNSPHGGVQSVVDRMYASSNSSEDYRRLMCRCRQTDKDGWQNKTGYDVCGKYCRIVGWTLSLWLFCNENKTKQRNSCLVMAIAQGGTHLKRGYGDVWPQDPLTFHASPAVCKTPVETQVHSQDPHLKGKCVISPPKQTFF